MTKLTPPEWQVYAEQYRTYTSRASIFQQMILQDCQARGLNGQAVMLDIGCGRGIENDLAVQAQLAQNAGDYIGVEPDTSIEVGKFFRVVHRCSFEVAPLAEQSVDVAFAFMVLEHIDQPQQFWQKLYQVLKPGGVFWGYTIDARHWFAWISAIAERTQLKNWYLSSLHGERGAERYENYPAYYRINTPGQVLRQTRQFRSAQFLNLQKVGQVDYYVPLRLREFCRKLDALAMRLGQPGNNLIVRVEK